MRADAYFFDIDGTLLITRDGVHRNALHRAMLEVYGVDTTIDGIAYHGKTDLGILRAALSRCGVGTGDFEAALPRRSMSYAETWLKIPHEFVRKYSRRSRKFCRRFKAKAS